MSIVVLSILIVAAYVWVIENAEKNAYYVKIPSAVKTCLAVVLGAVAYKYVPLAYETIITALFTYFSWTDVQTGLVIFSILLFLVRIMRLSCALEIYTALTEKTKASKIGLILMFAAGVIVTSFFGGVNIIASLFIGEWFDSLTWIVTIGYGVKAFIGCLKKYNDNANAAANKTSDENKVDTAESETTDTTADNYAAEQPALKDDSVSDAAVKETADKDNGKRTDKKNCF